MAGLTRRPTIVLRQPSKLRSSTCHAEYLALYRGVTLIVPKGAKKSGGFRVCVRTMLFQLSSVGTTEKLTCRLQPSLAGLFRSSYR
jgi:hypothetical protein